VADAEEVEEVVAMQTVTRLREAACPGGKSTAEANPAIEAAAESEEVAVLQIGKRTHSEAATGEEEGEEVAVMQMSSRVGAQAAQTAARAGSAVGQRYLPSVHAQATQEAFEAAFNAGGAITDVLKRYQQAGMLKKTDGTCSARDCYSWRGPTDCYGGECICQDGYGTKDGSKCVARFAEPLMDTDVERNTGGTCRWFSCSSSLGKTQCVKGKCICKDGYAAHDGRCVRQGGATVAKDVILTMLLAGVREPDELSCPGDTFERGTMNHAVLKMALGERHFNVSLCRTAVQVYHASPLPLVDRKDLADSPQESGKNNKHEASDLFSVMTFRQWRTHMLQVMSTEFAYAITMPDLAEGAKRMGNLFHTLGDTFSASHVVRASGSICDDLSIKLPMSMDVMNFVAHPLADMQTGDMLFSCSRSYTQAGIRLWAEARKARVTDARAANRWVSRLVSEVLCPALPIASRRLDWPAGGANTRYSADLGKPLLPNGMASEADSKRIIAGWAAGMAAHRAQETPEDQRAFPRRLVVPGRSEDACADPTLAHVAPKHVEEALNNRLPPQYLQPFL